MKKKIDQSIDENNPWSTDKLQRQEIADYLTKMLESITQPFVISLNSPYGTGKTDFILRWKASLKKSGFPSLVYFNAWQSDFSGDPFIPLVTMIRDELIPENSEEKLKKFAKQTGFYFAKKLGPALMHGAISKVLSTSAANTLLDDSVDEEIASIAAGIAEEELSRFSSTEESIKSFKVFLRNQVIEASKKSSLEKSKIIIFVDDLDRCRPLYAVQVLECLKHLFSVDGIIFVLAIDEKQVSSFIRAVYGEGLDSRAYLKKFIDWPLHLPKPNISSYTSYLVDYFQIEEFFKEQAVAPHIESLCNFTSMFVSVAETTELTLREIEQVFFKINLYLRTNNPPCAEILAIISILQSLSSPIFFESLTNKSLNLSEHLELLKKNPDQIKDPRVFLLENIEKPSSSSCPPGLNFRSYINYYFKDVDSLNASLRGIYEEVENLREQRIISSEIRARIDKAVNLSKFLESIRDFQEKNGSFRKILYRNFELVNSIVKTDES